MNLANPVKASLFATYALAIVACVCVLANLTRIERPWFTSPDIVKMSLADQQPAGTADGIDLPLIINSLATKPTYASTFQWWHTSRIPKVPFWRPLSIQAFWLEKQAFTLERFDKWMIVSIIAHLGSLIALGWLALALTKRPVVAWLAILFFGGWHGTPWLSNSALANPLSVPGNVALDAWKNQPDLFADLFVFLSAALTLRGQYYPAIAMAFIAVAFKESGWMAWPIDGLALLLSGRFKSVGVRPIVTALAVIAALIALRASAGSAVFDGYHQGTNEGWLMRLDHSVYAPYTLLFLTAPYNWFFGNAIGTAIIMRRRRWVAATICVVGLALSTLLQARILGEGVDIVVGGYTDPTLSIDTLINTFAVAFVVVSTYLVLRSKDCRPCGRFALGAALIAALPAVGAGQVLEHAFHQSYAFQSLWWAIAVYCVGVKITDLRPIRHLVSLSSVPP